MVGLKTLKSCKWRGLKSQGPLYYHMYHGWVYFYIQEKNIMGVHIVCDAFIIIMVTMVTMSTLWSRHNDAKFTVDTSYAFKHLTCVKQVIF